MALCTSLYTPLHLLEIALRNSLHAGLTQHHNGNNRWYELEHAFRATESWKKAQEAVRRVAREKKGRPDDSDFPGRVVAELDFGFWTTLLTRAYGSPTSKRRHWNPLWPRLVTIVFPAFPNPSGSRDDRATLAKRFDNIRILRNRVFHHEPVWKGRPEPKQARMIPLHDQYEEVIEALGWLCPEMVHVARRLETFPAIHASGVEPFKALLATLP